MPTHPRRRPDETIGSPPSPVNPRFVGVDELDRILDAIAVVSTHLEMEEAPLATA
jgi:hypothetical protein